MSWTEVATANVLYKLNHADATATMRALLDEMPDLVGLQEWYPSRWRLLRESGDVGMVPDVRVRVPARDVPAYHWNAPVFGDCVVGVRADRYDVIGCRPRLLSWPGRAERIDRPWRVEPPRIATVGVYRDRQLGRTVCLVCFHLAPGVQAGADYRTDRPVLSARHRRELRALERIVADHLAQGHVVHAVGDSNFAGLRISGLTSAWQGRDADPGTLGPRRKVDDVFGPGRAESVRLLTTASDHKTVVVRRADPV